MNAICLFFYAIYLFSLGEGICQWNFREDGVYLLKCCCLAYVEGGLKRDIGLA